jgi:GntR family transcriptional repressor for pyruvate dehydrogenase complex
VVSHLVVEKISSKKVSERVAEQIEDLIKTGHFKPGEKLPSVRELCDQFGIGRSAIRDAITTLKGKGIIDVRHGEGSYICEFDASRVFQQGILLPDEKDIEKLFQVREILESGIAKMAAKNRTQDDLNKMETIINQMKQANRDDNGDLDYSYHMAIANATKNEILSQLMEFISATTKKAMTDLHGYISSNKELMAKISEQHSRIFESIRSGDADASSKEMANHLIMVKEIMQKAVVQQVTS